MIEWRGMQALHRGANVTRRRSADAAARVSAGTLVSGLHQPDAVTPRVDEFQTVRTFV
jgi:hypothetical protein